MKNLRLIIFVVAICKLSLVSAMVPSKSEEIDDKQSEEIVQEYKGRIEEAGTPLPDFLLQIIYEYAGLDNEFKQIEELAQGYRGQIQPYFPKELQGIINEYIGPEAHLLEQSRNLMSAIKAKNFGKIIDAIERRGAYINFREEGDTPLIAIIKMGGEESDKYEILNSLIKRGANINARDRQGRSALIIALDRELGRIASFLIEKRADVNTKDRRGRTPLMIALDRGLFTVASDLISRTTDLNAVLNPEGQTALVIAAKKGKYELVKKLIERRADSKIRDDYGKTAYDYARYRYLSGSKGGFTESDLENYKKIMDLLSPEAEAKREEEDKELQETLRRIQQQEMEERVRAFDVAKVRATQQERQRQEEERLRSQRAQEAMIAAAAQPEEEEWAKEPAPAEEAEDWGNIEQED